MRYLKLITEGRWLGEIVSHFFNCNDAMPFIEELERRAGVRTLAITDGEHVLWMAVPRR